MQFDTMQALAEAGSGPKPLQRPGTSNGHVNQPFVAPQVILSRPRSAGNDRINPNLQAQSEPLPKRLSRLIGEVMEVKAGLDTFQFPVPSSTSSPQSQHTKYTTSPSLSIDTPSMIGIALGSPSHPPPAIMRSRKATIGGIRQHWNASQLEEQHFHLGRRETGQTDRTAPPTGKRTGWKAFSDIFRSKASKVNDRSNLTPKSRLDLSLDKPLPQPQETARNVQTDQRSTMPAESPFYGNPDSRRATYETPFHTTATHSLRPSMHAVATPRVRAHPAHQDLDIANSQTQQPMQLQLSLPAPELDRYSVMFASVLNAKSDQSEATEPMPVLVDDQAVKTKYASHRPSLLERRADKLRARSDSMVAEEPEAVKPRLSISPLTLPQRSMTTTKVRQMSTLTIKENGSRKSGINVAFHKPRVPQRSNTIATSSPSPARATFARDIPVLRMVPAIMECSVESPITAGFSSDSFGLPTPDSTDSPLTSKSWLEKLDEKELFARASPKQVLLPQVAVRMSVDPLSIRKVSIPAPNYAPPAIPTEHAGSPLRMSFRPDSNPQAHQPAVKQINISSRQSHRVHVPRSVAGLRMGDHGVMRTMTYLQVDA